MTVNAAGNASAPTFATLGSPASGRVAKVAVLFVTYLRLARREESEMIEKFGEIYVAYRAVTPSFLPSWRSIQRGIAPLPPNDASVPPVPDTAAPMADTTLGA